MNCSASNIYNSYFEFLVHSIEWKKIIIGTILWKLFFAILNSFNFEQVLENIILLLSFFLLDFILLFALIVLYQKYHDKVEVNFNEEYIMKNNKKYFFSLFTLVNGHPEVNKIVISMNFKAIHLYPKNSSEFDTLKNYFKSSSVTKDLYREL